MCLHAFQAKGSAFAMHHDINHPRKTTESTLMRLLMLTTTLSSMTALMFNIVLPRVSEEFQLSYAQVSWLSSGYTILYAFGTVTYGKLADRFKLKNLLTFGLSLFAFGSLMGLLSSSYWSALAGRLIQSVGAACVPALAMIIPTRYVATERRGRALGMTAAGVALGGALAPVVSALTMSVAHWRWLFVPPLLLLFTLPFYRRYLIEDSKETQANPETFDWLGGGLLAAAVALFLLGVTGQSAGLILAGLLALALFAVRIRVAEQPFIRPALFRNKGYANALSIAFLIHAVGISLHFLTPKLLAEVHHLDADLIGFAMAPAALASSILGRKGGKLADLKGNTFLYRWASGSLIACFLLLSSFAGVSPLLVSAFLIFGNVGQTLIGIAISNTVSRTLPKDQVGVGMGLFTMLNFIAQGVAVGVYGMLAEYDAAMSWNPIHSGQSGALYSNIYVILAAMYAGILFCWSVRFRERPHAVGDA